LSLNSYDIREKLLENNEISVINYGRGGEIRTPDPLVPNKIQKIFVKLYLSLSTLIYLVITKFYDLVQPI